MKRIMFVCLGNICRSAMAECIMAQLIEERGLSSEFYIDSAGTSSEEAGNSIYPPARRKLEEKGITVLNHRAKRLRAEDYREFDAFLCAEERNTVAAKRIFCGDPEHKVMRMLDLCGDPRDIADPWWTGDFEKTYTDLTEACECVLRTLINK